MYMYYSYTVFYIVKAKFLKGPNKGWKHDNQFSM